MFLCLRLCAPLFDLKTFCAGLLFFDFQIINKHLLVFIHEYKKKNT